MFFLFCHVETPGNKGTGAQFGEQENSGRMHIFKSPLLFRKDSAEKTVDWYTFSRARVGVLYRVP